MLFGTEVMLIWNPIHPENHNGIIRHYLINITELNTGKQFVQTSPTTMILLNLFHPSYDYTFTIAAVTVGAGPYSDFVRFKTLEEGQN